LAVAGLMLVGQRAVSGSHQTPPSAGFTTRQVNLTCIKRLSAGHLYFILVDILGFTTHLTVCEVLLASHPSGRLVML
jgi:hypothetical protein